ncbi:MAG: oligosaccharide flippase family protein, partial [Patescibacteria group bacterium]
MQTVKKISEQTLWQILDKGITSLSMIVILGLVARNYGAEGTGIFTLSLALLNLLYLGVDLGINAHALPESLKENFPTVWQKLLGLRLVLAGILVTLLSIAIFILPLDSMFKSAVLLGLLSIIAVAIFYNSNLVFQSRLRFDLFTLSSAPGSLIALLIIFLLVQNKTAVPYLLTAHTIGWFVVATISLILARRFLKIFPKFDIKYSLVVFKKIWPLSLTVVSNVIYFRVDAFILSAVKSFAEVGIYNLAYQIFQALLVVPAYIMNSFYPLMIKDFSEDRKKFKVNLIKA